MILESINKLKLVIIAAVILFVGVLAVNAGIASADAKADACRGIQQAIGDGCDSAASDQIDNTLAKVINMLSVVVGVISVIMMIIAGLKYTTSTGDSNSTASARNTIIYAVVGLLIVAMAQVIVKFVIGSVS